jgi:hypothetical protein
MESRCGVTAPDVVILSDDFRAMVLKSCFRVTLSRQQAWFIAALAGMGAPRVSALFKAPTHTLFPDGVFRDEKPRDDRD